MDESQAFWEKRTLSASPPQEVRAPPPGEAYRFPPGIQALADAYVGKRAERGEAGRSG